MTTMILESRDYEKFQTNKFNRQIKVESRGFQNLLKSMQKNGFLSAYPMHVVKINGHYTVVGGHHRFEAAKRLGIPVKYVIEDKDIGLSDTEPSQIGKWTMSDYFWHYVKKGVKDYVKVQNYMIKTGISLQNALSMLAGQTAGSRNIGRADKFFDGKFEVRNSHHADLVGDMVVSLKDFGVEFADSNLFVQALSRACFVPEFDPDRFLRKAKLYSGLLKKQVTRNEYLDNMEAVYNRKVPAHSKLPLRLKTDVVMSKRKQFFGKEV